MTIFTPQKKKKLSYERDRRNTYGENSKSSRSSIRFRKRRVNQTYRHAVQQVTKQLTDIVEPDSADGMQAKVASMKRRFWKKCPDTPLGQVVKEKLARKMSNKSLE